MDKKPHRNAPESTSPLLKAQVRLDEMSLKALIVLGLKIEGYGHLNISDIRINHLTGQRDDISYFAIVDVDLQRQTVDGDQ